MINIANQALVKKAVEHIDRDRLVDLVVQLVNVASPTGFEGDMAREFHKVLQDSGFRTTLQPIGDERYNAIGLWEGAGGGKTLLFNGHLDTSFGAVEVGDRDDRVVERRLDVGDATGHVLADFLLLCHS